MKRGKGQKDHLNKYCIRYIKKMIKIFGSSKIKVDIIELLENARLNFIRDKIAGTVNYLQLHKFLPCKFKAPKNIKAAPSVLRCDF